jgi:Lecithin:cholesterol acyltransferase
MAFTYTETRDNETLRLLTPAIDEFIKQCQTPADPDSPCPRQTVFFFPAGSASHLTRATKPFLEGIAVPQTFKYHTVWVALNTPVGGARDLEMHRDSTGTFRDKGDRIIVADHALSLGDCTTFNGFITWCRDNNVDLFVFPYDWRRRLDETATFFIGKFLPFFRARVQNAGCPNPLTRFALVGHSFGGMVANLILRGNDPILAYMTHVITVGTPFYGASGQVHRWFEGESWLNGLGGLFKEDIMKLSASLPALYTLHFLDELTFNNATNQAALAADAFPLNDYPSMDATTANLRADPYNPQTSGANVRYPMLTGFDRTELDYARAQFQLLASPMDPDLLKKFYNIRGVRTANDGLTPINDTVGSVTWSFIPTNFDASDPSPIHDHASVPGDKTHPAWSACLVTNAANRRITVKAHDLDHMFLMNHSTVLNAIQDILCPEGGGVSPSETQQPEEASDDDVVEFLQWLSQNWLSLRSEGLTTFDDPRLKNLLPEKFREQLPSIARRFISDVMKRPGPTGLRGPEGDAGGRGPEGPADSPPKAPGRQSVARTRAARSRQRKPPKKKQR